VSVSRLLEGKLPALRRNSMSWIWCLYSPKELEGLDDKAKDTLQKELKKQVQASREIRAILDAHEEANKILKEKLRGTYNKLKK
jgi:hypothetical protein